MMLKKHSIWIGGGDRRCCRYNIHHNSTFLLYIFLFIVVSSLFTNSSDNIFTLAHKHTHTHTMLLFADVKCRSNSNHHQQLGASCVCVCETNLCASHATVNPIWNGNFPSFCHSHMLWFGMHDCTILYHSSCYNVYHFTMFDHLSCPFFSYFIFYDAYVSLIG